MVLTGCWTRDVNLFKEGVEGDTEHDRVSRGIGPSCLT